MENIFIRLNASIILCLLLGTAICGVGTICAEGYTAVC